MKKLCLPLLIGVCLLSCSLLLYGEQKRVKKDAPDANKSAEAKKDASVSASDKLEKELAGVEAYSEKIQPVEKGIGRYLGNLVSLLGIFLLLGLAWVFSLHRWQVDKRMIVWGIGLQLIFAVMILHTYPGRMVFDYAKIGVNKIISFTGEGANFVLGALSKQQVMDQTIQSRVSVYQDSRGVAYVNGRVLDNGTYAGYVKNLKPHEKKKALPTSWPSNWESQWADPANPARAALPPGLASEAVKGLSYEQLYGYGQGVAGAGHPGKGFVFVFQILTTIIFFASLMGVLYHLGIMQWIVYGMAVIMAKTMKTSGAESLSVAANVFVGQTEAPLVVKPYVNKMTKSELMALMTGGFATIAGGVLVAYVAFGISAGHLLAASVMSAPAALVMAKIMVPETEESVSAGKLKMEIEKESVNVIDAAATGAADGMGLVLNVAAMLLAFVALIAMIDWLMGLIHSGHNALMALVGIKGWVSLFPQNLTVLFGYLFFPVALAMGVPWDDCFNFAHLIGVKITLTEFIAYLHLKDLMPAGLLDTGNLSPRAAILAAYALCGFANFGSVAIQLGGIGSIAPERRHDLARLGLRAMFAGALASFMTATIAGVLLSPKECKWRYAMDLADRQIETHLQGPSPKSLADFARPFYQYWELYPGEDIEAVQGEVRSRLRTIFEAYSKKGKSGHLDALRFGKVFQKRYPIFAKEVGLAMADLLKEAREQEDKGMVNFVETLKGKILSERKK